MHLEVGLFGALDGSKTSYYWVYHKTINTSPAYVHTPQTNTSGYRILPPFKESEVHPVYTGTPVHRRKGAGHQTSLLQGLPEEYSSFPR